MKRPIFIATLTCFAALSFGAKKFPGIQAIMTPKEFSASGLHKLTEAELAELNRWVIKYTANEAPIIREQVEEVKTESVKDIHSSIVGEFKGWKGKTRFRLENGQVWQQRLDGKWKTNLTDPEVIIRRNLFGFYEMEVVEANKRIGVKRIN